MMDCYMQCHGCGAQISLGSHAFCPQCGGILTVEYTDEYLREAALSLADKAKRDMWDYDSVLPPVNEKNRVTFREGCTPLKKSWEIGEEMGLSNLYFKDETANPSGSFKDRSVSVCVSMAKEFDCPGIVVSSSGNGGAATGAYGTKGAVDTIIFVPEQTPVGKVAQAIAYGGRVIKVKGNFSCSYRAAMEMAQKKSYMNVTTTFLSPFGLEGYKIMAYELFEQLGKAPDYIFIPVGAGPVLYGIYKGFSEMKRMGWTDKMPRLICAQAKGCAPISQAWMEKRKVVCCENPCTVASAISDPLVGYERDGDITIEAIEASGGYAFALEDEVILETGRKLARREGIFVEASSAASLAALQMLQKEGVIASEDICVCLLTGHGLKDSAAYVPKNMEIPVIETIAELEG